MVALPPATPATMPVPVPTEATRASLLVQVPGMVMSLSVVVVPWHRPVVPVMAAGGEATVTVAEAMQPAPMAEGMIVVPVATPPIGPSVEPIVAVAVLVLLHVPPLMASVRV